jgi:hypothetical protein
MAAMDWGTVPTWVSAFLTGGSLLLGFYILLRDRRKEERAEARKLVFSVHWEGNGSHTVRVTNVSERAFLYVGLFNGDQWEYSFGNSEYEGDGPMHAGEYRVYRHDGSASGALAARFQDADGQNWVKIFDTHQLIRAPRDPIEARHFERRLATKVRRTDEAWAVPEPRRWDRVRHPLPRIHR